MIGLLVNQFLKADKRIELSHRNLKNSHRHSVGLSYVIKRDETSEDLLFYHLTVYLDN